MFVECALTGVTVPVTLPHIIEKSTESLTVKFATRPSTIPSRYEGMNTPIRKRNSNAVCVVRVSTLTVN